MAIDGYAELDDTKTFAQQPQNRGEAQRHDEYAPEDASKSICLDIAQRRFVDRRRFDLGSVKFVERNIPEVDLVAAGVLDYGT